MAIEIYLHGFDSSMAKPSNTTYISKVSSIVVSDVSLLDYYRKVKYNQDNYLII